MLQVFANAEEGYCVGGVVYGLVGGPDAGYAAVPFGQRKPAVRADVLLMKCISNFK